MRADVLSLSEYPSRAANRTAVSLGDLSVDLVGVVNRYHQRGYGCVPLMSVPTLGGGIRVVPRVESIPSLGAGFFVLKDTEGEFKRGLAYLPKTFPLSLEGRGGLTE